MLTKLDSSELNDIFISGIRRYDMAVRLQTAGLDSNSFIIAT